MAEALLFLKAFAVLTVVAWALDVRPAIIALAWLGTSVVGFMSAQWVDHLGVFWYLATGAMDAGVLYLMSKLSAPTGFKWIVGIPLAWCVVWSFAAAIEFHTVHDGIYSVYPWAITAAAILECFGMMAWSIATGRLGHGPKHGRA